MNSVATFREAPADGVENPEGTNRWLAQQGVGDRWRGGGEWRNVHETENPRCQCEVNFVDAWLYSASVGPCDSEDLPDNEEVGQHGEDEKSPLVRTGYLPADEEHYSPKHRKPNCATASQSNQTTPPLPKKTGMGKEHTTRYSPTPLPITTATRRKSTKS